MLQHIYCSMNLFIIIILLLSLLLFFVFILFTINILI